MRSRVAWKPRRVEARRQRHEEAGREEAGCEGGREDGDLRVDRNQRSKELPIEHDVEPHSNHVRISTTQRSAPSETWIKFSEGVVSPSRSELDQRAPSTPRAPSRCSTPRTTPSTFTEDAFEVLVTALQDRRETTFDSSVREEHVDAPNAATASTTHRSPESGFDTSIATPHVLAVQLCDGFGHTFRIELGSTRHPLQQGAGRVGRRNRPPP